MMIIAFQAHLADPNQQVWVNPANVAYVEHDGMPATKRANIHLVDGTKLTVYIPAATVVSQLNSALQK